MQLRWFSIFLFTLLGGFSIAPLNAAPRLRPTVETVISQCESRLKANALDAAAQSNLANAYLLRYREAGDASDVTRAETLLRQSLKTTRAPRTLLRLGRALLAQHRFKDALAIANEAARRDREAQRLRVDVLLELGDYPAAEAALGQIAPGARDSNFAALQGRWHELHGRTDQAIENYQQAAQWAREDYSLTAESAAWFSARLGEAYAQSGRENLAAGAFRAALALFANDYRAMNGLARLAMRRRDWREAVQWGQRSAAIIPSPEIVALLADAYAANGQQSKARAQLDMVETIALLARANGQNFDRQRVLFLCDHDRDLREALRLARGELKVRQDIYAWDALAWALYKNRDFPAAEAAARRALALNTADAMLWFHAGAIARAQGQKKIARARLLRALAINPRFHFVHAGQAQSWLKNSARD